MALALHGVKTPIVGFSMKDMPHIDQPTQKKVMQMLCPLQITILLKFLTTEQEQWLPSRT